MLAVYNYQSYYRERRSALALWSNKLTEIVSAEVEELVIEEPDMMADSDLSP